MVKNSEFVKMNRNLAEVAKLADALGLGPSGATRGSSTLPFGILAFF